MAAPDRKLREKRCVFVGKDGGRGTGCGEGVAAQHGDGCAFAGAVGAEEAEALG